MEDDMRTIYKTFDTAKQANRFYLRLCSQYDVVRLISAPFIGEQGIYAWNVAR